MAEVCSMVDTVLLNSPNSYITTRVDNLEEVADVITGEVKSKGRVRNLSIRFSGQKVTIIGSLSKYYFGTNFYDLNRSQLEDSVNMLSSKLNLPICDFDVYQLHIGKTILMDHPVSFYLEYLTGCRRHKTMFFPGQSITFTNGLRSIIIYDKLLELQRRDRNSFKRLTNEGHLKNKYALRYELQIKRRLKSELGSKHTIKVKDLYSLHLYGIMVNLWKDSFFKIETKREILDIFFDDAPSLKELNKSILAVGIKQIGRDNLFTIIGRLHSSGEITTSAYYRERKKIDSIENRFSSESKYLRELREKIVSTSIL